MDDMLGTKKTKFNKKLKQKLLKKLKTVYNRGFSTGFYLGKPINEWSKAYGSKATKKKQYVGKIVNYYNKVKAAEIKIESNEFKVGDTIMFQGPTTGVFEQKIESIQVNGKPVKKADKKNDVAVKTVKKVRKNDKVYVIISS
jgi:putative protease